MAIFRGKRVSRDWDTTLRAAWSDGVRFVLNSGQRTLVGQAALVRQKGLWTPRNPTGAAAPSPNAPHIRRGKQAHALDVSTLDGGHRRLAAWLTAHGLRVRFPILAEPWHMEVEEGQLIALARRLRIRPDALRLYPEDERRWIREYDQLRRLDRLGDHLRVQVLRRVMRERRKAIWRAAQRSGWGKLNRRRRYQSLLARSR
jgi:hypothetical protein